MQITNLPRDNSEEVLEQIKEARKEINALHSHISSVHRTVKELPKPEPRPVNKVLLVLVVALSAALAFLWFKPANALTIQGSPEELAQFFQPASGVFGANPVFNPTDPGSFNLSQLGDVEITAGAFGDLLMYDGTNWVDIATSTLEVALSDTKGTLTVARGGTGLTTFGGTNTLLYTTAADTLSSIAIGTGGQVLAVLNGTPTWTGTSTFIVDDDFSTNGFMVRTASGSYASRTVATSTDHIVVVNPDGVSGNPTLTVREAAFTSLSSLATVGTITTGTWDATTIAVTAGGSGAETLTDGGILLGSGTGVITPMSVLGDGVIIVGDNATDPTTIQLLTNSTGFVRHEVGGLEFDASAITTGGLLRGASAGAFEILTLGTAGQLLGSANGQLGYIATSTFAHLKDNNVFTGTGNTSFAGNVGFGTTTPAYLADIDGSLRVGIQGASTNYLLFGDTGTDKVGVATSTPWAKLSVANTQTTYPSFAVSDSSNNTDFVVLANGNVGIGTTAPTDTLGYGKVLDLQSSTGFAIHLRDSDAPTTNYGYIAYDGSNDNFNIVSQTAASSLHLGAGGSSVVHVTSAGNVGIGTTTPAYLLDVDGDFRVGIQGSNANLLYVNTSAGTLKIPSASNPTITSGTIAIDTNTASSTSFQYDDDTNDIPLYSRVPLFGVTIASSTLAAYNGLSATSTISLGTSWYGENITKLRCYATSTGSVMIRIGTSDFACNQNTDDKTANINIRSGRLREVQIGTSSGTWKDLVIQGLGRIFTDAD